MYLSEDVVSSFIRGLVRGRKGEKVSIISRSEPMVVVEVPSGDRFAVHESKLQEDPPKKTEDTPSIPKETVHPISKPTRATKRKKAPVTKQNQLFK